MINFKYLITLLVFFIVILFALNWVSPVFHQMVGLETNTIVNMRITENILELQIFDIIKEMDLSFIKDLLRKVKNF